LTGDFGAHHITGMAGRPIAQGLLTAAVAPLLRGDDGFHLSSMEMTFLAPVYAGDTVTATVRITDTALDPTGELQVGLELAIGNQDDTPVITGVGTGRLLDAPAGAGKEHP
jgi:3-hydroxybutyryl-CoA dehydratase